MSPKFAPLGVACLLAALVGCQKRAAAPAAAQTPPPPKPVAVEVVKPAERSKSFLAVNRHLELGGTLYGYVDVDGDVTKVASNLQPLLAQVAQGQPALAPRSRQSRGFGPYGKIRSGSPC